MIMSINYLADLHENMHLFHGDIKPDNFFMCTGENSFISSDSGSLILLDDPKGKYQINVITPFYASKYHNEAFE